MGGSGAIGLTSSFLTGPLRQSSTTGSTSFKSVKPLVTSVTPLCPPHHVEEIIHSSFSDLPVLFSEWRVAGLGLLLLLQRVVFVVFVGLGFSLWCQGSEA